MVLSVDMRFVPCFLDVVSLLPLEGVVYLVIGHHCTRTFGSLLERQSLNLTSLALFNWSILFLKRLVMDLHIN